MKKVLLFVLATLFAYTMNAQTLLNEGFESGIPATWSTIDNDGDGNNWSTASSILTAWGYDASNFVNSGSDCAMSISYDDESGDSYSADNYLVTPQLTIPSGGAVLSFYVRSIANAYPDDYMVKLSTGGNAAANFTVTLQALETASGSWTNVEINLSEYAGQNVYIAFVHQSEDMYALMIDDVTVSGLSTTPEIALTAVTLPTTGVDAGVNFNVGGTVKNLSTAALTSFDVTYSVNGGANVATYTVTGINVATNETYDFTHNVPASVNEVGVANITVTVSNPNGTADNTEDNTLSRGISICGTVTAFPYYEGFETGIGCWTAVSMNEENTESNYGVTNLGSSAHGGENVYVFNSYAQADDFSQYIISPELSLTAPAEIKLYHAALSSYGTETFQIMASTTTNDVASFTAISDDITASTSWEEASATLAANVKYVAIKYTSDYQYYLGIDDISITAMSNDPEIALTAINTPSSATVGTAVNVSGVVRNNSAADLTSFDVAYTFDGTASATYNVTGINIAAGETYTFTHNTPISNLTSGNHTLIVTVSNPNGTADNTTDNSLTKSVMGCDAITTFPYHEGFDTEDYGCWLNYDGDGNGIMWQHLSDIVSDPSYTVELSYNGTANGAISSGYNSGFVNTDNWLISPAIQVPATGTYAAKWYAMNYDAGYAATYKVYIATSNDIATLSATTPVVTDTPDEEYTLKAAMLNNYAGQTIYIAFRHQNTAADQAAYLFLEEFSIETVSTDPEIALTNASAPASVGLNTAFTVSGTVINNSATPLTSFDVACTVNGETTNTQVTGINVPYTQTYDFNVNVSGIATTGNFDITLTVSNPNGTADLTNDNTQTTTVNIYDASTSVQRTVLLENFTGAWCQYCPGGHDRIHQAINGNDRVIWIAHHVQDDLSISVNGTLDSKFNDIGYPSMMLDRTYWEGESFIDDATGPDFFPASSTANGLGITKALAEPAFVTVNIGNVTYDASTRALSATVSGNVTGALATTDARLNVWLMEDGLLADGGSGVGHGPTQTNATTNPYYHDYVVRKNLSANDWGDANVVTPTAGTNYTKTYSTTVSQNFDPSKCYLVAFVSSGNTDNRNTCRVFNSAKGGYLTSDNPGGGSGINDVETSNVKLYPNPTTGNLYIEVEGLQKVEVIDAVGRIVMTQNNGSIINMSNLANGIYTVRVFANGNMTVKKVVKR